MGVIIASSSIQRSCSKAPPEGQYVREGAAAAGGAADEGAAGAAAQGVQEAMGRARTTSLPLLHGAGLALPVPPEWRPVEHASPMRLGTFEAGKGDQRVEIVFFHFGKGQGGGAEANLLRWSRQVLDEQGRPVEPAIETFTAGPLRVTLGAYEGTYLAGPPGSTPTPQRGWGLVGAVVEGGPDGAVFARMTGPAAAVRAMRPLLTAALRSVTIQQPATP